jgi:hypothetical protein
MSTHPNSRSAHKRVDKDKRRAEILSVFEREGNKPMTDREIAKYLGYHDLNSVRPRLSEMVADKTLREYSTVICPVTKRPVRQTMIVDGRLF